MKLHLFLLNIGVCFVNFYYVSGADNIESLTENNEDDTKINGLACNLPCQNGGVCLPLNVCGCPKEFKGPQCQYSVKACASNKPEFNGIYNCTKDEDACAVSCPYGMVFEFQPAPVYTCSYATARFLPEHIPQCEYPNPVEIDEEIVYKDVEEGTSEPTFADVGDLTEVLDTPKDTNKIIERKPEPGSCFTWGGSHFKTFDKDVFSFNSPCAHILVRDAVDNTFTIITENSKSCFLNQSQSCHTIIKIYLQEKEYILDYSDEGIPIFLSENKVLAVPGRLLGVRTEISADYIIVLLDLVGVKIKWDGRQLVQVEVKEGLWNKTEGLCGKLDGDIYTDRLTKDGTIPRNIITLASSWQVDTLDESCKEIPTNEHTCKDTNVKGSKGQKALEFCQRMLFDKRFSQCQTLMDIRLLMDACLWDYCSCNYLNPERCACETLNVYVRECTHKGIQSLSKWRDEDTCPMHCTDGKVYMPCVPTGGQTVCGEVSEKLEEETVCEEGCYCPKGTYVHDSKCITKEDCPCKYHGKDYPSGSTVPKDCNTCTCSNGKWICTEVTCATRCSIIGDPHYITFDGKRYDFMGKCTYYLVEHENFTIEMENVACGGAVSQAGAVDESSPSCPKTAIVKVSGKTIKVKQGREVTVNGQEVSKIPYYFAGVNVRMASSMYLVVELPNGIQVWWDGTVRAHVDLPPTFIGETKGLCGTFNKNQKDDFLTPEGDVEQTVTAFANKWKTSEKCGDISEAANRHPCDVNVHNKKAAEDHCKFIKSQMFTDCHGDVDPEPFYENCLYDVCACNTHTSKCLCPMIAAYAEECARKGVNIYWRSDIRQCGLQCPSGQTYQICGNSCTRSCYDIATKKECQRQCVEGCNCHEGETLDENGECIPIGQCDCHHDGLDFPAGYKEVRYVGNTEELCTCANAHWACRPATREEIQMYPKAIDIKSTCSFSENKEFTTCEPIEPKTCKNMHTHEPSTSAVCHAGCRCKSGYVLDTSRQICVRPSECPCHHGGRSYTEHSTVESDCNMCTCKDGKWHCVEKPCSAECSAWGDSHYKTLDGKLFDFQGQCDYMLVKGTLGNDKSLDISVQNVPCSSLGVSCSKSITIKVGGTTDQEHVTLTQGKEIPQHTTLKQLSVRQKDHFVIVESPELGITVRWDKGTRVYVKLSETWKNKVKGLCGNYNDDELDDFQTPSGGIAEVSAKLFGDSWRLQPYCPEALEITNTCEQRPERKVWALKQCGILKSSVFSKCHFEVPFEPYFERCVFDTCACDQGGDCDCLCTALAAYAQQCNTKGIPIKWRTPDLCPMQCDARCAHYSPCVSTCPVETCDNILMREYLAKTCELDTCIEGCQVKSCPDGFIYSNSSLLECVPSSVCKPFCLELYGVKYYEGDLMEEDECHSCYCSRGKETCKGQPCVTGIMPVTPPLHEGIKCKAGWTDWINQNKLFKKTGIKEFNDVEPLPGALVMNDLKGKSRCNIEDIVSIECRTVDSHIPFKETGLNVECSLERGLVCSSNKEEGSCVDFEIRVECFCGETTTLPLVPPTSGPCDVLYPYMEMPYDCHSYLFCEETPDGPDFTVKTCGDEMFNPRKLKCDRPEVVMEFKPQCSKPEVTTIETEHVCRAEEEFRSCFIECHHLCSFYSHVVKLNGYCAHARECEEGCVSINEQKTCAEGMFWANNETCVAKQDCMCVSYDGKPVKPGSVIKESDCEICQCIDNYYSCSSSCPSTTTEEIEEEIITVSPFIPPTFTPPPECVEEDFIYLIDGEIPLSDEAFSASTTSSRVFVPKYARLNTTVTGESGGSWVPKVSNKDQYLQIDLGRQEPIYGVIVKGNPVGDKYVTSYSVLYSNDGHHFYYIVDYKQQPEIFRGSFDPNSPVKQMFEVPIEAKIIRINPRTWHNDIALRVELIGCKTLRTTTITTVTPPTPICIDPMGVNNGMMSDQQISVSSEKKPYHTKEELKTNGKAGWQPITNSPSEWAQFDFLELRNITGFITKGGTHGWVTAFVVKYSQDGKNWNTIMDKDGKDHVFPGNVDKNTPHITNFDLPIQTKVLRVVPVKWHENIQLRIEPQGCFIPYIPLEITTTIETPVEECNTCDGVPSANSCQCEDNLWWNGTSCTPQAECPCFVGHVLYPIGTSFEKEDCSQCICKLGGVSHCEPKVCPKCEDEDLQSVATSHGNFVCNCHCQPCDEGTRICPTANICINNTFWCNGVKDCPDDETGCEAVTTTVSEENIGKPKIPKPSCPPGYELVKKVTKTDNLDTMFSTNMGKGGVKGGTKGGVKKSRRKLLVKSFVKTAHKHKSKPILEIDIEGDCEEYECVFINIPLFPGSTMAPCPEIVCPSGYTLELDNESEEIDRCPKFKCKVVRQPDAVCNITGNVFSTFDYTEYKYDICNHILARDLVNNNWEVLIQKNCTKTCTRSVLINIMEHDFVLYPDLSIRYNGYKYTVEHAKKIESHSRLFAIAEVGDSLIFVSNMYGFWVIWDKQENVKVGVTRKLLGKVDGMCGYFNDDHRDDKLKPDKTLAKTTAEFGDSWFERDESVVCQTQICPVYIQYKAQEICNLIKEHTFTTCAHAVNLDAFITRCTDLTCKCLEAAANDKTAQENCRCLTLQNFVVDCLAADSNLDVIDWRMKYDCPAACETPLVHYDCYRRECEPSCGGLSDPNICPKLPHVCFPGCYCPPGYVRKGSSCILPINCGDCECNVLPHLEYVTYDERNFTLNGNCTYVMSQDVLDEKHKEHKFQVLITNRPCKEKKGRMCVGKVTVLYKQHEVHVKRDLHHDKLKLIIDSKHLDISDAKEWLDVKQTSTKHLRVLLKDLQILVSIYYPSLGVSIKAPSLKFGEKLEGLCGDCNGNPDDDLPSTSDVNDFALRWLYGTSEDENRDQCINLPPEKCKEVSPDSDPCLQLENTAIYGQCHPVLDPSMFVDWCKKDTCDGSSELSCGALAVYSLECANLGFCINWHNHLCPPAECPAGQEFRPCAPPCPQTCEALKDPEEKCTNPPVDGCFCPEGQVFLNGTCVVEGRCDACDDEGHHSGDIWLKDVCTNCSCDGTNLKCETQTCPSVETVCEEGYIVMKVPATNECCDKYKCVYTEVINATCEPPQEIQCGEGQRTKLIKTKDGCQQFVCECIPIEDCEPIDTDILPTEPGIGIKIDESGCCPVLVEICNVELCPEPPLCPQFHLLEKSTVEGKCCSKYTCSPPENKCIVDLLYMNNENGGEKARDETEKEQILQKVNGTWEDGPCRKCLCIINQKGEPHSDCSILECPDPTKTDDYEDYVLEAKPEFGKCCPTLHRVACRHNGKVYELGKKIPIENDNCTTIKCIIDVSGRLVKRVEFHSCETNCDVGWEYVPPTPELGQCCGSCEAVGCFADGILRDIGEEWTSEDFCTTYVCTSIKGSTQVQSSTKDCPLIPRDMKNDYVLETVYVEGQCCGTHKVVACLVGTKILKVGETWASPDNDKCKKISCIENELGEINKKELVETCTRNCSLGSEYIESTTECCGECVQVACVIEGESRNLGDTWISEDNCTAYTCETLGDQLVVVSEQESCPNVNDCPLEYIYTVGCCQHCNTSALSQVTCGPMEMKFNETIGLFSIEHHKHGLCINKEGVKGFTECVGTCKSYTAFNSVSYHHDAVCSCCQVTKYEPFPVTLNCEDGYKFKNSFTLPSECGCKSCEADSHAKNPSKTGVKDKKKRGARIFHGF